MRVELSAPGTNIPMSADEQTLTLMPDYPTRADPKTAQSLMHKLAGPGYLIDKTPLQESDWHVALIVPPVKLIHNPISRGELLL
jgi:hypothetical protein